MQADINLEYVDIIKDPIWAEVPLTQVEKNLINTKGFSRLRHIRQMGFAYLSFPGANHTRYEHSIGAMRAAHLLYQMFSSIPIDIDQPVAIRSLRIATLLHDLGHPPFSHAVEETFHKYPHLLEFKKDDKGKYIQELRRILGDPPKYDHEQFSSYTIEINKEISDIIKYQGLDVNQIKKLAIGRAKEGGLSPLNPLLDGDFDADKIDYIIRDSYYCGLSHKIDLNEFRGKLIIERVNDKFSHKLFLLPEGVSAIDSLLLARYKLIKEVHNNESNRIATQMLIEKIRLWLQDLSPDERAREIFLMHTSYTDYDFVSILSKIEKGPNIDDIMNGKLYETALIFPFKKMHPVVKAATHLILNNPMFIPKMQDRLREDFQNTNLILDIREPKPPKFTTLIRFEEEKEGEKIPTPRNIFDRYYTPHGILIDSFNDLEIYLYGPVTEKDKLRIDKLNGVAKESQTIQPFYFEYLHTPQSVIARRIILASRETRTEKFKNNIIIDIDLLLIVLATIEEFGKKELFERELWIYSDSALQRYLQKVVDFCKKEKIQIESNFVWDNQMFSTKIFRDMERLINIGLVDHIHKPVPHVSDWGFRVDRRISGWGKGYVSTELYNLRQPVYKFVRDTLDKVKHNLKKIIELELLCTSYDEIETISKREPLNRQIEEIRSQLKKNKDIILTIG